MALATWYEIITRLGLRVWDSRSRFVFHRSVRVQKPRVHFVVGRRRETVAGRTPRECYRDFMVSFRDTFENLLQTTISEIAVGCGPCGELRYPSYPENKRSPNSSQWRFPGIGEFQCYDQRALGALARHAAEVGRIEWGGSGPHDYGRIQQLTSRNCLFPIEGVG